MSDNQINLTTRKHSPAPKVISSHIYDETTKEYVGKFSEAYREAGHDFTKSFKVLRLAYLFLYHILTADDVFLYETLQLLCERAIPFTLERLAEELGKGKNTIRESLDNLINAELLEIVKSDGQGAPNFYILRTPYFQKDSIVGDTDAQIGRQNRIIKAGFELPETFVEDHYKRLKKQVKENKVKKFRELCRSKEKQAENPQLYKQLKAEADSKVLTWHKIIKKLGNTKAAAFDNLIYKLTKGFANVETLDYWQQFKISLKKNLEQLNISFDEFLFDYAKELSVFYDQRRADTVRRKTFKPASRPADDDTTGDGAEDLELAEIQQGYLRTLLTEKAEKVSTWSKYNISDFARMCREYGANLQFNQVEAIAADVLPANIWQKIKTEIRQ